MSKEPKPIRFDEVMKELDKFRKSPRGAKEFTPEMDKLLLTARTGKRVVSYDKIAELWEKLGWGHIAHSSLATRLRLLQGKK